ncbi:heat shock factor family protein [Skeletonema marinoi]|uniref:Heat shock factor family protein n=1 Tax=Skeletonema marinoi TaxID=267567 RepID=A0AAD8XSS1_9STRA|nr:heat shock factor family protein [Skeletonema marinoi]
MSLRKTLSRRIAAESTSATSKSVMKKDQQQQTFPFKLYEMLEYACDSEFISSLSWSADGSAFVIHDKDVMMNGLAPMFFKQTKFRSFTRQLNIWGFVRTETIGGVRGGWQHENFLSGRPDLLKGIERTEVKSKSASKKSSSTTKSQTSSRSVRRAAKSAEKVVIVADESSGSSAQVGSQASLSSYKDISAASIAPPVSQAFQGPVFHYFDHILVSSVNCEQSNVQDSVSLSSSSVNDTTTQFANTQQVEEMYSDVQPFNSDDLMYLASIFEKDDHHSNDGDLSSILSLNQETSLEDYTFNL